jgi:hypothetical protein
LPNGNAFAVLAVFGERAVLEALLVAQFHAREIEHAVLHGAQHLLAAAGAHALIERRHDAEREMQAGAGIADLRAGDERRPVAEAGGRGRAAGALRDVLVDLAVLVGTGAEALHRGDDHARIELVDVLEGEPHAVERAGREILHQHVAFLHQPLEDFLALGVLGIDRDRALAAVEHGEIEAVGAFTSRSWPRVTSPTPGRSTLITSAPMKASSCVQVGPDCTWVKSRMRTPSSARPPVPTALSTAAASRCFGAAFAAGFFAVELDDFLGGFFAAALDFALRFGVFSFCLGLWTFAFLRIAMTPLLISCEPRFAD